MSGSREENLLPGANWLSMPQPARIPFLAGIIEGLNQGVRHCSAEIAFALSTRLSDSIRSDCKLSLDSLLQQVRLWSKSSVVVFKFSKPLETYAETLTNFYRNYPEYKRLLPAYLLIYMDDQHGMGCEELYALHVHSLQGFKL